MIYKGHPVFSNRRTRYRGTRYRNNLTEVTEKQICSIFHPSEPSVNPATEHHPQALRDLMLFSSLAALGHVSCQLFTVEKSLSDFFCWELVEGEGVDRPKGEMIPKRKMNFSLMSVCRVSLPWLTLTVRSKTMHTNRNKMVFLEPW